jgi:transmembrane sensor
VDPASLDAAWHRHQLVVTDQPLADVLDALSRHRPGKILYDRQQIAALRVSAVLPLDDTDRALRLLHSSFPTLRLRTLTPYLVMVDAPP